MPLDELVLTEEVSAVDINRLRSLLVTARARGFESLLEWAELAMQWAEGADAELAMLRPKPGQAHIHGDTLVTAAGRRYCLKHPGFELRDDQRCIRCHEIEAWLQSPILYE